MSDKLTATSSGNGYCKMPDGTLIQWGVTNVATAGSGGAFGYVGDTNITFGISFLNGTAPVVVVSPNENGAYWNAGVTSITKTGCTLSIGGNQNVSRSVSWIAIGRWK